ncbi:hypothetical protein CR513_49866, partial [Mucuna pruriens]
MYYYGSSTLIDGLYCFNLDAKFMESLLNVECIVGTSKTRSHIQRKNNEDICLDCIKGKHTKQISKNYVVRNPFMFHLEGDENYFITFIDEFSHYCYFYLLYEKFQLMDVLKVFSDEVERQLNRKVKVVRFDKGGEFYGKFN